jgi:hypothetical protein
MAWMTIEFEGQGPPMGHDENGSSAQSAGTRVDLAMVWHATQSDTEVDRDEPMDDDIIFNEFVDFSGGLGGLGSSVHSNCTPPIPPLALCDDADDEMVLPQSHQFTMVDRMAVPQAFTPQVEDNGNQHGHDRRHTLPLSTGTTTQARDFDAGQPGELPAGLSQNLVTIP